MRLLLPILCVVCTCFYMPSIGQVNDVKPVFIIQEHDFGDLVEGEKKEFVFEFVNKGSVPFIITNVHVQCGCTAPEWSTSPVFPNQKGVIKIIYDSTGKEGIQRKVISVESNATDLIKLKIVANVLTN